MLLIKPDPNRRIDIPGVPVPVRRPVDIDEFKTGFTRLRTLRIYYFDEASVIEGHAEEDEVFLVVLAGSIELTMRTDALADQTSSLMSAPGMSVDVACAAYLPRLGAYKLVARTDADVAYARSTPVRSRPPKLFYPSDQKDREGASIVLEETDYGERLRLRLIQFNAQRSDVEFSPVSEAEAACEQLIHVRTELLAGRMALTTQSTEEPILLESCDTVAVSPGERPSFKAARGTAGLALILMAS
jgi:hypothetical protein